jgi:FtsP/CotA-like multicopper oxidase with cupredoxin domain
MDRSGYARGTLAPRPGMSAPIPRRRPRPLRTMEDMGMSMQDMKMGEMDMGDQKPGMPADSNGGLMNMPGMGEDSTEHGMPMPGMEHDSAAGQMDMPGMKHDSAAGRMDMPGMEHDSAGGRMDIPEMAKDKPRMGHRRRSEIPGSTPVKHGPDTHGTGNQTVPDTTRSRLADPGDGLGKDGWRVLVYTDLKALTPYPDRRAPERELEIHLTGHMERFMWSFDGKKYSEAKEPIHFRHGERLRWTFVNDTMMEHPLHLHGMFVELENGTGDYLPRKHTVIVKPAERVSVAITADARGRWAFHCHLLLHMEAGMFRVVEVADGPLARP